MPVRVRLIGLAACLVLASRATAQDAIPPAPPYEEVAAVLERLIQHEIRTRDIPAVSVALVADGRIVWSRGFGVADPRRKAPATAETVYRVGSVSKLFTDLALMQLVEAGKVDLDAPVSRYLPDFAPKNPSGKPITLRQMMSHRSGLTREPPVGHYFDPTGPSLEATVRSLTATELIYPPETRTKYSNAAISVVGQVVAAVRGEPFESTVKATVLDPMGLTRSGFRLTPELAPHLAKARTWTLDGRTFEAPTFPLGISSAGNLYSTVNDLGRFLSVLMRDGRGPGGAIVSGETLRAMETLQFAAKGQTSGFGLGFQITELDGRRRIGHGGAVYGFSTEVAMLPEEKLGVAIVASKDCVNGVVTRLADDALRGMLAASRKEPLPAFAQTEPLRAETARSLAGRWTEGDSKPSPVFARGGSSLFLHRSPEGPPAEVRRSGDRFVTDGPLSGIDPIGRLAREGDLLNWDDRALSRDHPTPPAPPDGRFLGLIGEYGWDHNVLYVFEEGGRLRVLIEWFFPYTLTQTGEDGFDFPRSGLYDGETVAFTRDASGRAVSAKVANVEFLRRAIPGEDGKTFRVVPLRPVAELREAARKATPPAVGKPSRAADLVDLTTMDPTIRLDIRYASENNFLGTPFYTSSRAFLQRPAAEALREAHRALAKEGLGLLIHDAYRPWYVTKMFWDGTSGKDHGFVADPSKGSKHNRGCAVDLSLYDLKTGKPVELVGGYDEFSDRSNPDYPGGTSRQRWYRDRLRRAMEERRFTVNEAEWWHFDFRDWAEYPILNETFEQVSGPHPASP